MKVSEGLADLGPNYSSQQLRGCDPRPPRPALPSLPAAFAAAAPQGGPRYLGSACSARAAMAAPLPPRLHGTARGACAALSGAPGTARQGRPAARHHERPLGSKQGRFLTWAGKGSCSPGGLRASADAGALPMKRAMPRVAAVTSAVGLAAQSGESSHCQTALGAELRAPQLHAG